MIPDTHVPFHDRAALECALAIQRWYKPDETIILGDFLDCSPVSRHNRAALQEREGMRLAKDFEQANAILDIVQANSLKTVYLCGNHELWINNFVSEQPELEGLVSLELGLKFKERKIKFLPYNVPYRLGKLAFTHGLYTGQNHAAKHVNAYGCSIVYGHLHDVQLHVKVSPVDVNDKHLGLSLGCLAEKNPHYMRNRPSNWVHACGVGLVRSDGTFNIDPIIISNGKASYAGRTFGK